MNKKIKKVHFPKTRLSKLVARSGGVSSVAAIENARKNIELMRAEGDQVIIRLIAEIDAIVDAPRPGGELSEAEMNDILVRADQIVTLAETFGHDLLDTIAKSLCDMVDGLLQAGKRDLAPVRVHVQAMDMMVPGSAVLSVDQSATVLSELSKVRKYFNITAFSEVNPEPFGQDACAG